MEYVQSHLRGSTQQYVPLNSLREMPVPVTDNQVMYKTIEVLKGFDDKIETNQRINDNLAA